MSTETNQRFDLSGHAVMITGETINVDGGKSMHRNLLKRGAYDICFDT